MQRRSTEEASHAEVAEDGTAPRSNGASMRTPAKGQGNKIDPGKTDPTLTLSDALLKRIIVLALEGENGSAQYGLVCHRWLRVVGGFRRVLRLRDWDFLESGRLSRRFPNLTDVDVTWASIRNATRRQKIILSIPGLLLPLPPVVALEGKPHSLESCIRSQQISVESLDRGLAALASGCPDLKRLRVVDVGTHRSVDSSFAEWEFVSSKEKGWHKEEPNAKSPNTGAKGEHAKGNEDSPERARIEGVVGVDMDDRDMSNVTSDAKSSKRESSQPASATSNSGVENPAVNADSGAGDLESKKSASKAEPGVASVTSEAGSKDPILNGDARPMGSGPIADAEPKETPKTGLASEREELVKTGAELGGGALGKGIKGEAGLVSLGRGCPLLEELEVHQCTDETVGALVACQNVKTLRLVGTVPGISSCSFTDVGLTILANRCRRLVKLELKGCEASFAGIAAIGQCCSSLQELALSSAGFQGGWVAALSYFTSLKTLRLESCKHIDRSPGPPEHLESCGTIERLHLACCDVRDKPAFGALLTLCVNVRELEFRDCWGLDDEIFALTTKCRRIRLLSLDGCSLVTAAGLEAVAIASKELQRLRVVYCGSIRDSEISPAFGNVVVTLKEFIWRPDTKSHLSHVTDIAQPGRWFFRKS